MGIRIFRYNTLVKKYYDEQKTKGRGILAVFNLDLVGESPVKIGIPLIISSPNISTPSHLRALLKHVVKCVTKQKFFTLDNRTYQLNYRFEPFAGGSDHIHYLTLILNHEFFP